MANATPPLHALLAQIGPLTPEAPMVVVARPGVGKTPLMAHIALHALQQQQRVLHVSLGDGVEHVRAHYDEVLRTTQGLEGADHATAIVTIERRRMVLSYAEREFDPQHLREQARMLSEVAQFSPDLLVIDGIHAATFEACGDALLAMGKALGVPTWLSVTTPDATLRAPGAHGQLRLLQEPTAIALHLVRDDADERLPWVLDPASQTLVDPEATPAAAPVARLEPAACTLFSGGAGGSEATFGEIAAAHGLTEVTFSFEGHRQARTEGRTELTPRELEAGDVSLVYVSRRLHRDYNQHGLIRRVLQTLWHMVSRSQQIFVIGVIQEDGTVVGGTGWSVELARMWSKELWVYDQDRQGWFQWNGEAWVAGEPRITSAHICGTGTRYLEPHGREAIEALFARSFPGS